MRDYQSKSNIGGLPDSITSTKFGAGEFNSITNELEFAVESTGQTLAPADGTGEDTQQLAKALSVYGSGGDFYQDSGAANAYVLDRIGSLSEVDDYFDGMQCIFVSTNANTGASTVNVASLGVKSITRIGGAALSAGDISTGEHVVLRFDSANDRFEIEIQSGVKALEFVDGITVGGSASGDIPTLGSSGTFSGKNFSQNGTITITDTGSSASEYPLFLLAPNSTLNTGLIMGKSITTGNAAYANFIYSGDDSPSNIFRIGLWSGDGFFDIYNDGHAALTAGYLTITDPGATGNEYPIYLLAPNTTNYTFGLIGKSTNSGDASLIGHYWTSDDSPSNFTILGCNGGDGFLRVYNDGHAELTAGYLTITDDRNINGMSPLTILSPNLPASSWTYNYFGTALSTYNYGILGFYNNGVGSTSNQIALEVAGSTGLRIFGDGHAELTAGYLDVTDSGATGNEYPITALAPNGTTNITFRMGKAITTGNCAQLGFAYAGDNSPSNRAVVGTFGGSGRFDVYNDGHAALTAGYLNISDDRDADFMVPLTVLAANLTVTRSIISRLGVAASNYNSADFGFYYAGSGSQSNELRMGLFSDPDAVRLNGYGNVGIGTAPAGSGGDRLTVSGDMSATGDVTADNIKKTSVSLNGDFSAGTLYLAKSGNVVVAFIDGPVHTAGTSAATAVGLIPSDYRPEHEGGNCYFFSTSSNALAKVWVESNGRLTTSYSDFTGTAKSVSLGYGGTVSWITA